MPWPALIRSDASQALPPPLPRQPPRRYRRPSRRHPQHSRQHSRQPRDRPRPLALQQLLLRQHLPSRQHVFRPSPSSAEPRRRPRPRLQPRQPSRWRHPSLRRLAVYSLQNFHRLCRPAASSLSRRHRFSPPHSHLSQLHPPHCQPSRRLRPLLQRLFGRPRQLRQPSHQKSGPRLQPLRAKPPHRQSRPAQQLLALHRRALGHLRQRLRQRHGPQPAPLSLPVA
jgi:hypothetical protein